MIQQYSGPLALLVSVVLPIVIKWMDTRAAERAKKPETDLAATEHMSKETRQTFDIQAELLSKMEQRVKDRDGRIDELQQQVNDLAPKAARVPDLEARLERVENHFLDCARLVARIQKAPTGQQDDQEIREHTRRVTAEGLKIAGKRGEPLNPDEL